MMSQKMPERKRKNMKIKNCLFTLLNKKFLIVTNIRLIPIVSNLSLHCVPHSYL